MEIVGKWLRCDDGVTRPVIKADVLGAEGKLQNNNFLVDIGADRTVFSASLLKDLDLPPLGPSDGQDVKGIGGLSPIVLMHTVIQFTRRDGFPARVHGQFAAFTDPDATDFSILGRDVLNNFDVIISRPRNEVLLLSGNHRYQIIPI
jgi:type 1 glutamine amidotransferase